jgi:transposase-like protein
MMVSAIIQPGSSGIHVTDRERQVAELIASGWSHKKIAHRLGISTSTISVYVHNLAERIPSDTPPNVTVPPTLKVTLWWLMLQDDDED